MSSAIKSIEEIERVFNLGKYPLPKRFRHHISPNTYLPLAQLREVPPSYPPLIEKIDWSKEYTNKLPPNTLDIGCGFGQFIIKNALAKSIMNHLGLEVREIPVNYIQNVIDKEQINNLIVRRYSVANGLQFIADDSISEIYYFFPDPWYKNKHIKRRAFNLYMLSECFRVLKPESGKFYIQTDVEFVDDWHKEIINQFGKFKVEILPVNTDWELTTTNQEELVRKKQLSIYKIILSK